MTSGGTLFTMTYYGSQMVVEHYNLMGPVKAALESATRYLAAELGPKGIRVHAISPGPLKTRAASGITSFDKLLQKAQSKAPSRSLVSVEDVGVAVAFLGDEWRQIDHGGHPLYRWRLSHHRLSLTRRIAPAPAPQQLHECFYGADGSSRRLRRQRVAV